jgi:hypothetical protein
MKKSLTDLIRENPGAVFVVDNDCWWMHKPKPASEEDIINEEYNDWASNSEIARGDASYGFEILLALAEIVGVKVEMV